MGGCIAERTRQFTGVTAAVCLGIVLDKLQRMAAAYIADAVGIGAASVHVDNHNSLRAWRDGTLYEGIVYLERVKTRLHKHGFQSCTRHGYHAGDVGIGRDYHLVALLHLPHLHVGTQDKSERIKPVAACHTARGAGISGVRLLETLRKRPFQKPTAVCDGSQGSLYLIAVQGGYLLYVHEIYHRPALFGLAFM